MVLDNSVEIIVPDPDSQYRLLPCECGSDNVAYMLGVDGLWRGHCFECGRNGAGAGVRHEAQIKWNKKSKEVRHGGKVISM